MNNKGPVQHVCIVIPTYNEQGCIKETLLNILAQCPHITAKLSILVFDSHSTDNTPTIVQSLQSQYPQIYLSSEPQKTGLGSAYIQAMGIAMDTLHPDAIIEFDADGSHQPHHLPKMIEKLEQGADVVIGSRYVKGGSIPADWPWHRKCLSVMGNLLARFILIPQYKDITSGFRATRTTHLKKIQLSSLLSYQYAYKIHLVWELHRLNLDIQEIPIDFIDRTTGVSKFPKNNVIDSLRVIFTLRLRTLERFFKVCCVGLSGIAIQFTAFNLLRTHWPAEAANALAIECAIINNFLLNNQFSFKEQKIYFKQFKKMSKKFFLFNSFSMGSFSFQILLMHLSQPLIGHSRLFENGCVLVGIILGSLVNYYLYQRFVWSKKHF